MIEVGLYYALIGVVVAFVARFIGDWALRLIENSDLLAGEKARNKRMSDIIERLQNDNKYHRDQSDIYINALENVKGFIQRKKPPFQNAEWLDMIDEIHTVLPKLALTYQPQDLDETDMQFKVERELQKLGAIHGRSRN